MLRGLLGRIGAGGRGQACESSRLLSCFCQKCSPSRLGTFTPSLSCRCTCCPVVAAAKPHNLPTENVLGIQRA